MVKKVNLETIFRIVIIIALVSVVFDISVTYTFYKKDVNYFLNHEGNRSLVGELKEGISFFGTLSFWFMLICVPTIFYIITTLKLIKSKYIQNIYESLLIFFSLGLIGGSLAHIYGGLTWLI